MYSSDARPQGSRGPQPAVKVVILRVGESCTLEDKQESIISFAYLSLPSTVGKRTVNLHSVNRREQGLLKVSVPQSVCF